MGIHVCVGIEWLIMIGLVSKEHVVQMKSEELLHETFYIYTDQADRLHSNQAQMDLYKS